MVLNELAQWSVLLILAVFVFGLTRALGRFMSPPEAQRSADWGPALGERLPETLLSPHDRSQISSLIVSGNARSAALIVVHERCEPCETWLGSLARSDGAEIPLVILTSGPSPQYEARLSRHADLVISDDPSEARLRSTNLTATPFLMLIDKRFVVRHKQLGGDLRAGLSSWPEADLEASEVGGNGAGTSGLRLTAVTSRKE